MQKGKKIMKYNPVNKMLLLLFFVLFVTAGFSQGKKDTLKTPDTAKINTVQIDTSKIINQIDTTSKNVVNTDSIISATEKEKVRFTNTNLAIYIFISIAGLVLFFYLFVKTLFRTFHKTKSTRQSLLLSWNLFFIVSIIWIFIIWGIVAGMWISAAFMTIIIFLFILSLIMSIISIKSK